ncbi:MAG: fumarate reductase subunit FrdD [Alishewanella aestuarii]
MNQPKRSDEPIWWALFSAGGVCFAMVIPGLVLTLGLLYPLGLLPEVAFSYSRVQQLLQSFWGLPGLAFAGAAICLPLFHAMHRVHHGLHDLKLAKGLLAKAVCYGLAAIASTLALLFCWQSLS